MGPDPEPVLTARAITLAVTMVTTSLLLAAAAIMPLPYVVTSPGPTFDTLGKVDGVELISVVGAPSYESEGQLRFTTVSLVGGPGSRVSLLQVLDAWWRDDVTVHPVEDYFPPDQTAEEADEQSSAEMISSQEMATVAALDELGYEVPTTLTVGETLEGSGAFGLVEPGDVMVSLDGVHLDGYADVTAEMETKAPGDVVQVGVLRDGDELDLAVTTTASEDDGRALLGVLIDPTFDMPVDVRIQIENVGGPSAGTMFALGIINTLTEADETGGVAIAGTGTMDLDGTVGPIGGIAQKMVGAHSDGAEWFLAPVDNCGEVVGAEPRGLGVVAVATLAEARSAVEAIGAGDGDTLRTCRDVLAAAGR
jgi:PDZ domain-containing protein